MTKEEALELFGKINDLVTPELSRPKFSVTIRSSITHRSEQPNPDPPVYWIEVGREPR